MILLALASLALLSMVAVQDYLVPSLRQDTISAGLTGPYHGFLDASYVLLATALCMAFTGPLRILAVTAAAALLITGVTNTFHVFVDRITGNRHAVLHTIFTGVLFAFGLALECAGNQGALWALTVANLVVPGAVFGLTWRKDYAEKLAVLCLCLWLIAWALIHRV